MIELTYDEYNLRSMLDTPKTELSQLIGSKWFLSAERLAEATDLPIGVVFRAVQGKKLLPRNERKIRRVLDKL